VGAVSNRVGSIQTGTWLYLIKSDPWVKNLEGNPRYKAFLRKMHLP